MKLPNLLTMLLAIAIAPMVASAATITWNPAVDTVSPGNISLNGNLVEAINATNSNNGVTTVNGVGFSSSNALLPGSSGANFLAGNNTGDAGLNTLLNRLDFGGGTSTSASLGGGLTVGNQYEVQVFFTDLRGCCNGRDMTFGDGLGSNVNVNASGGAGAFGQSAIGTFTADTGEQTLAMITNGFGNAHISAYQIRDVTNAPPGQALIDDGFDNGDLGSGGINGGFRVVTNAGATSFGPVVENASQVSMTTATANNDNSGIVSVNSFDALGQDRGFKMTFEIDSVSADPQSNGMFLGLQGDGTTFYRTASVEKGFGLVFSGNEGRTASGAGFGLVTNDFGSPGSNGNGIIFDDNDLQLSSLQDGFTAMITATPEGWAYTIMNVNDVDGNATTIANTGAWLDPSFYFNFFDNAEHLAAYTQRGGGGANNTITTLIGRIAVESVEPAVPEPATGLLALMGIAGLAARRRRAAN